MSVSGSCPGPILLLCLVQGEAKKLPSGRGTKSPPLCTGPGSPGLFCQIHSSSILKKKKKCQHSMIERIKKRASQWVSMWVASFESITGMCVCVCCMCVCAPTFLFVIFSLRENQMIRSIGEASRDQGRHYWAGNMQHTARHNTSFPCLLLQHHTLIYLHIGPGNYALLTPHCLRILRGSVVIFYKKCLISPHFL